MTSQFKQCIHGNPTELTTCI